MTTRDPRQDAVTTGRVLVTGARGFIGSSLVGRLCSGGAEVHATSRSPGPARSDASVSWHQVDLEDAEPISSLVRAVRPDLIIHLAARNSGRRDPELVLPVMRSNLVASVNVMTAALQAGDCRILLAGSVEEPSRDEEHDALWSPYAVAKLASREYAGMFQALWGLPVAVLKIAMVYGPGQADLNKLVPYVITSMLRGEAPAVTSGDRCVDWVYIDDVVDAFLAAARSCEAIGLTIPIGSGLPVSIREIVDLLGEIVGRGTGVDFGAVAERPFDGVRIADTQPAELVLQWRARTTLRDGLTSTVRWYDEQMKAGSRT